MRWYLFIPAALLLCSCDDEKKPTSTDAATPSSCKGIYTIRDSAGDLQKYNQYWQNDQKACLTDKIALTNFEKSSELRRKHNVTCTPQPSFPSMTLKSSGNYYAYRNDRYYLDLDSSTGIFRRITLGEDNSGNVVYQRDISCFYARTDHETEPVNPKDYGSQILLDFSSFPASSADFVPNEIFKYTTDSNGNWYFTRYDDVADWSFAYCPTSTPYDFCTERRNGNLYFEPVLDTATQASLLIEAKLIRTQFNFAQSNRTEFEMLWDSLDKNGKEVQQGGDWRYYTSHFVDSPKLFDFNWRRYLMGFDFTMPDISTAPQLPPVCYSGSQVVALSGGGSGRVYGQICFVNGVYSFTQY